MSLRRQEDRSLPPRGAVEENSIAHSAEKRCAPSFSLVARRRRESGAIIGPVFALSGSAERSSATISSLRSESRSVFSATYPLRMSLRQNLGIGLIGTGLGVFIHALFRILRPKKLEEEAERAGERSFSYRSSCFWQWFFFSGNRLGFVEALVLVVGIYLTTYLSGCSPDRRASTRWKSSASSCSW